MNTTKDIDTAASHLPAITINDDKALCDLVHEAANLQLLLNRAEATQSAAVEAAKKAFADATREHSQRINAIFAAVEQYAAANRSRLFMKGGKEVKTCAIMQHKLQYLSSKTVQAPADAVQIIRDLSAAGQSYIENHPLGLMEWNGMTKPEVQAAFDALIRQPEPELNKEAVKTASQAVRDILHLQGIRTVTQETFKLAFTFTPSQS